MAPNGKKIIVTVSNDLVTDQRMDRICTSLTEMGFEVELVGRKLSDSFKLGIKSFNQKRVNLFFNNGPLFYIALNMRLLFYLLATRPDIVYSVDADTALAGIWAKRILRLKLIFDAHELFSEVPELQNRNMKQKLWQRVEKSIIQIADIRITVSESIANHFEEKYLKSFNVIMNVSRYKPIVENSANEKYILYQGALNEGRGLEQLIKASKKLDIKIKIAGQGDLTEDLKTQAENLNNVEFLGKISPDKLELISANAWLGYNVLDKKSLSYYYSLSNKTFDYIQAGIPQLMSDFPEYRKLNSEWNFGICINLTTRQIVENVDLLLKNKNYYEILKSNALKASHIFNWENEEIKLEKLMQDL